MSNNNQYSEAESSEDNNISNEFSIKAQISSIEARRIDYSSDDLPGRKDEVKDEEKDEDSDDDEEYVDYKSDEFNEGL